MTVNELKAALQAALDRGLPGETEVVIDTDIGYMIIQVAGDPSGRCGDYDMWFTLSETGEEADCRFTTGGMPFEWHDSHR